MPDAQEGVPAPADTRRARATMAATASGSRRAGTRPARGGGSPSHPGLRPTGWPPGPPAGSGRGRRQDPRPDDPAGACLEELVEDDLGGRGPHTGGQADGVEGDAVDGTRFPATHPAPAGWTPRSHPRSAGAMVAAREREPGRKTTRPRPSLPARCWGPGGCGAGARSRSVTAPRVEGVASGAAAHGGGGAEPGGRTL